MAGSRPPAEGRAWTAATLATATTVAREAWRRSWAAGPPDLLRFAVAVSAMSLAAVLAEAAAALLGRPAGGWWVSWWMGAAVALALAPGLLGLAALREVPLDPRLWEGAAALLLLAALSGILFGGLGPSAWGPEAALAVLTAPILWVALRAPAPVAALAPAVIAPFALWGAVADRGAAPGLPAAQVVLAAAAVMAFVPAHLVARLRLAEDRLRAALSSPGATAALAQELGHELAQPLTAVANYAAAANDLLEADVEPDREMLRELLNDIATQALRAGRIVRGLRDLAAQRDGTRHPEPVVDLVEEALALALAGSAGDGVTVAMAADDQALVLVDRVQIQQVVVNLVRNAAEAMAGRPRREVRVGVRRRSERWVEVSVSDAGPGVAPAVAARLFEPFVTTKRDGKGLGLSVCRSIVEAHGGALWLEARGGPGATFAFTLPCAPDGADDGSADGGGHD